MGFSRKWVTKAATVALALAAPVGVWAQTDADLTSEAANANALYQAQNLVGALPLYEDLHKRQPDNNLWRERLALSLLGAATAGSDSERAALRDRAHQLLLDAKAHGDNSNLLQVMLEKMEAPTSAASSGPPSPGQQAFDQAEKAFASGDLPGALKLYEQSAKADPKLYEAPLYAGDTEFKQGHFAEADKWYARAAAINPDRETAYRYWGDSLMKENNPREAENKFIDAIIAEPYTRTTRVGLKQWADATKVHLGGPAITLPAPAVVDAKGNTTINVDPSLKDSPTLGATMAYSMGSTVWRSNMFQKTYPNEKQYRHSLAEEAQSIRTALSVLRKNAVPDDKLDATWRTLLALDGDGMLESWILLDHADQGIAQDYPAYRAQHRDSLHAYIAKYDVHP